MDEPLKITAYQVAAAPLELRTGARSSEWMDHSDERFAYRCLPLLIAMQSGWELICPADFTAVWNGDGDPGGIQIDMPEPVHGVVDSHFGEGVLTFHVGWLFRTHPGHNLWVKGPANRPKHGIQPLEGMIETDWLPFTFTLNWLFTAPGCPVRFSKGEAVGTVLPYPRDYLERFNPLMRASFDDPELETDYRDWMAKRDRHNRELVIPESQAARQKWQRHYTQGLRPGGEAAPVEDHQMKVELPNFRWEPPRP